MALPGRDTKRVEKENWLATTGSFADAQSPVANGNALRAKTPSHSFNPQSQTAIRTLPIPSAVMPPSDQTSKSKQSFAAPSGTRDLYPLELAKRRWIEDKWRKVAVRHGFEEIDGPTFEYTDLYTAKSGEGIVNEIFGTFSGKDEAAVKEMGERLARGEKAGAPFALRPEFTPTLARMYAARAGQLPKPCKWFWQGPCYRAERPQRGRLREFWQWNVDILGGDTAASQIASDVEILACCVDLLESVGLKRDQVQIRFCSRTTIGALLRLCGVSDHQMAQALNLLDKRGKIGDVAFLLEAQKISPDLMTFWSVAEMLQKEAESDTRTITVTIPPESSLAGKFSKEVVHVEPLNELLRGARSSGIDQWLKLDFSIVRGLAYYTGTVFEVIVDGERAVAGGGRYDNLIETFGGPPTPAVGFGMGDVVLSLVLQDKGLMPSDKQIAADLGLRPDVFVISNGQPESDAAVGPMLAQLRRKGMHARRSYKSTKNVGKLLQDAAACGARFAVIIESASEITLKNMDDNTQEKGPTADLLARLTP
ncbi:MAG: histidine--tRNA ligase [Phycisphaerales bacterium]